MSFQQFQGVADTGVNVGGTDASRAALLKRTRDRIAAAKIAEEQRRSDLAKVNLTGKGLVLDTNLGGGQSGGGGFEIIGGKAVRTGGRESNISSSIPSLKLRDGRRVTADSPNLTDAQKSALGIISGQRQATVNLADKISRDRRVGQNAGLTVKEAQNFATDPRNNAFTNRDKNIINTTLQTDIIRSNSAKLNFAEQLIQQQTSNEIGFNTLDDLQAQLDRAPNQDAPIQNVNVSTDKFGNVVSPRNVKLQIENAGLTGGLTQPVLNILTSGGKQAGREGTNNPNVEEIAQVIRTALADVTDNAQVENLTSVSTLPDGTLAIDFSESAPDSFRQLFGDAVFDAIGRYFDLKDQGVDNFFDNPEGLRIKIGEEEVSLGGSGGGSGGFASELLDNQGFDILGLLTNPVVLIAIVGIIGAVVFLKVRK